MSIRERISDWAEEAWYRIRMAWNCLRWGDPSGECETFDFPTQEFIKAMGQQRFYDFGYPSRDSGSE